MDEADVIADRKLILNKGVIRCLGTSIYLKSHFHMKYSLDVETDQSAYSIDTIIKQYIPEAEYCQDKLKITNPEVVNPPVMNVSKDSNPNSNSNSNSNPDPDHAMMININDLYQHQSMNSNSSSNNSNDHSPVSCYSWKLPIQSTASFSELFRRLEMEKENHTLQDFSVNAPLLEELFVRLEREDEPDADSKAIELPNAETVIRPSTKDMAFRFAQYRIKSYFRNYTYLIIGVIMPVILISVFLISFNKILHNKFGDAGNIFEIDAKQKEIKLNAELYKGHLWNYDERNSFFQSKIPIDTLIQAFPPSENSKSSFTNIPMNFNENSFYSKCEESTEDHESYYVAAFGGKYDFDHNILFFEVKYNYSIPHAGPVTINALNNAVLAAYNINETIQVSSHPLNRVKNEFNSITYRLTFTVIFVVALTLTLGFYGSNTTYERITGLFKKLQLNGVSNSSYWMSVFLSDYLLFIGVLLLIFIAAVICRFIPFYNLNIISILVAIVFMLISALACLIFQYVISFKCSLNSTYFVLLIVNIVPSIFILCYFSNISVDMVMLTPVKSMTTIQILFEVLPNIFLPVFCAARIFKNVINLGLKRNYFHYPLTINHIFSLDNFLTIELACMFVSIIFYGYILRRQNRKYYCPNRKGVLKLNETIQTEFDQEIEKSDEDIRKERERVMADRDTNLIPIRLYQLTREHQDVTFDNGVDLHDALKRKKWKYGESHISTLGSHRIITDGCRNVNIGIDHDECFGLLGPNGSGKTTLLDTATLTYQPTLGSLSYDGKDMLNRETNSIPLCYCPQENSLWEDMTLYEHVEMMLYLQGYTKSQAKTLALQFIDYCQLGSHKNKLPDELSGGTRRKLNILLALCCISDKILLDEPTAGMDPSTRRYVWNMFKATIQSRHSSTIMCTHSMEEAEILCDRVGIIVNGKLRCIGTPEHLRMKYGNTYILDVHSNDVKRFNEEVINRQDIFQGNEFVREEKSLQRVKYEITETHKMSVSRIFEIMESCRENNLILDYSYSKSNLEQVFINFANLKDILD